MATDALAVTCPQCSNSFRVKPEAAGRSVKCPKCRRPTQIGPNGGDSDPAMEWLGLNDPMYADGLPPLQATPPATPAPSTTAQPAATAQRPLRIRDEHSEPARWRMLKGLRITYFVLAGLAVCVWLYSSAEQLSDISEANAATDIPYPAGVPEGASSFDPSLTDEQREALSEYEIKKSVAEEMAPIIIATSKMMLLGGTFAMVLSVVTLLTVAGAIELGIHVQDDTRRAALYASRIPIH